MRHPAVACRAATYTVARDAMEPRSRGFGPVARCGLGASTPITASAPQGPAAVRAVVGDRGPGWARASDIPQPPSTGNDPADSFEHQWARALAALESDGVPVHSLGVRYLSEGCYGDDVSELQRFLREQGVLDAGEFNRGFFGSRTREATASWQLEHDVPPTGAFGELSRMAYLHERADAGDRPRTSFLGAFGVGEARGGVSSGRAQARAERRGRLRRRKTRLEEQERAAARDEWGPLADLGPALRGAAIGALIASLASAALWSAAAARRHARRVAELEREAARSRIPLILPPGAAGEAWGVAPRGLPGGGGGGDGGGVGWGYDGGGTHDEDGAPRRFSDLRHEEDFGVGSSGRWSPTTPIGRVAAASGTGEGRTGADTGFVTRFNDERGAYTEWVGGVGDDGPKGTSSSSSSASFSGMAWRSKYAEPEKLKPRTPPPAGDKPILSPFGGFVPAAVDRPRQVIPKNKTWDDDEDVAPTVRLSDLTGPKTDGREVGTE